MKYLTISLYHPRVMKGGAQYVAKDLHDRATQLRRTIRETESQIRKLERRIDEHEQERAWQARKLRAVLALIGAEQETAV